MDLHNDYRDGAEVSRPLGPDVRQRLQGAIDYLMVDPTVERGVMLRKDLSFVPFDNVIPHPQNVSLISMGPDGFADLARLVEEDDLYGWLHSHPHWAPFPSLTDIRFHQFPGNMLIYGVPSRTLMEYTTPYITMLENTPVNLNSK